jgi:alkanesulfonate monooxygenase SsuD/methylene tetrahydromethanopterin reductase-like flavin-dependent oxidoreductase (luciferase family)
MRRGETKPFAGVVSNKIVGNAASPWRKGQSLCLNVDASTAETLSRVRETQAGWRLNRGPGAKMAWNAGWDQMDHGQRLDALRSHTEDLSNRVSALVEGLLNRVAKLEGRLEYLTKKARSRPKSKTPRRTRRG